MVKKAGFCVVCLGSNHAADSCNFKDDNRSKCGLDGCVKPHHPSLHGSRDPFVTSVATITTVRIEAPTTPVGSFASWKPNTGVLYNVQTSKAELEMQQRRRHLEVEVIRKHLRTPMLNGDHVLLLFKQYGCSGGLSHPGC